MLPLSITAGNNVTDDQLESMLESGQTDVFTQNVSYISIFLFQLAEDCIVELILTFGFLPQCYNDCMCESICKG